MPSRSGQRKSVLVGPMLPVPTSPLYGWFDSWTPNAVGYKSWYWMIPNDGMSYKLCGFRHVNLIYGFHYARVDFNSDTVFARFEGYENIWAPSYENAPSLVFPDVITVYIVSFVSYAHSHYWEMDFWREQIH